MDTPQRLSSSPAPSSCFALRPSAAAGRSFPAVLRQGISALAWRGLRNMALQEAHALLLALRGGERTRVITSLAILRYRSQSTRIIRLV